MSQKGQLICVRPMARPSIAEFVKVSGRATTRRMELSTGQWSLTALPPSVQLVQSAVMPARRQMNGIHSRNQFVNSPINISQSTTSSAYARSRLPSFYDLCDRFLQPSDKQDARKPYTLLWRNL